MVQALPLVPTKRIKKHRLEALHDAGGLDGVGAGADVEVEGRCRDAQVAEEDFGHLGVVMLASMNKAPVEFGLAIPRGGVVGLGGFDQRRDLHEIGARAGDE